MNADKKFLIFAMFLILITSIAFSIVVSSATPQDPKVIPRTSNYWDFYTPFSDIYIKGVVRSGDVSVVYLYPSGSETFSFENDGILTRRIGNLFIECTRSGNGKYITITDTNIPFLPKVNPSVWGDPVGNADDIKAMKELFKTQRSGQCDDQVNFMVSLASDNGIVARRINMWQSPSDGVLTAEGHTTMEIYDRKTKQWVWMDPLYNVTEGKVGTLPVTFHELRIAINRGENITLTFTDDSEIQFGQWGHSTKWKNYVNPTQTISYVTPDAYYSLR